MGERERESARERERGEGGGGGGGARIEEQGTPAGGAIDQFEHLVEVHVAQLGAVDADKLVINLERSGRKGAGGESYRSALQSGKRTSPKSCLERQAFSGPGTQVP